MGFALQSTAFKNGGEIPKEFTCDGADTSPPLSWTDPPPGTKSFALIMEDPDAPSGTFIHWVVWNLPATTRELAQGTSKSQDLPAGAQQGKNGFGNIGYGGPCPPPGKPHRYFFKLFALDTELNVKAGASKREVEQAMRGHVLAEAELMGRYARK